MVNKATEYLQNNGINGWLIADYNQSNPIFERITGNETSNITRPIWIWITSLSEPQILVHEVDIVHLDSYFNVESYGSRTQMIDKLNNYVKGKTGNAPLIAMEYSNEFQLPQISKVSAGVIELIASLGAEIISSADLLQYVTETWSGEQFRSHVYAAEKLTEIVSSTFNFIGDNIRWAITEHDVSEHVKGLMERSNLVSTHGPVIAFNKNSSHPHYTPDPETAAVIRKDGWLLIDVWGKEKSVKSSNNVYADITWVAAIGDGLSEKHKKIFEIVTETRDLSFDFIKQRLNAGDILQGWEVDNIARKNIQKYNLDRFFFHRLGHSLGTHVHSDGVNLDDWESKDTRKLINEIGFTIEPGIYLEDFGMRSEINIFINDFDPIITTPPQTEIVHINT